MGVKPQVLVELQEDKTYYADDIIPITISLRLEREWKNPYLTLSFKGYASSYKNSIRQHNESIFGYDEDIPIEDYNKQPYNTTHEIRTVVSVPRDTTIPCSKKLKGADGGKIEYMIEVRLGSARRLKDVTLAHQIIVVTLAAKLNISKYGLKEPKRSTDAWPTGEKESNTCLLSASIPRQGWLRDTSIEVQIDFKQPEAYTSIKSVMAELICQESIALAKDNVPDTNYQLNQEIIQTDTKDVEMYSTTGRMKAFNQRVLLPLLLCFTPTIARVNAKVVKLEYKIRVSVILPGKGRKLQVDLPVVIGTTETIEPTKLAGQDLFYGHDKPHQIDDTPLVDPIIINYQEITGNYTAHTGEYITDSGIYYPTNPGDYSINNQIFPPPNEFEYIRDRTTSYSTLPHQHGCIVPPVQTDFLEGRLSPLGWIVPSPRTVVEESFHLSSASTTAYMSPAFSAATIDNSQPYQSIYTSTNSTSYIYGADLPRSLSSASGLPTNGRNSTTPTADHIPEISENNSFCDFGIETLKV